MSWSFTDDRARINDDNVARQPFQIISGAKDAFPWFSLSVLVTQPDPILCDDSELPGKYFYGNCSEDAYQVFHFMSNSLPKHIFVMKTFSPSK